MRYAKQENATNCGPVALGNALKFLGVGSYWKNRAQLTKLSGWRPDYGTPIRKLARAGKILGKKYEFSFVRMYKPTYEKMRAAIKSGTGLIVAYDWFNLKGGHFVFVHQEDGDWLNTANEAARDEYEANVLHRWTPRSVWEARIARGGFGVWRVEPLYCIAPKCKKQWTMLFPMRWCDDHWREWWDCSCSVEKDCRVHGYAKKRNKCL